MTNTSGAAGDLLSIKQMMEKSSRFISLSGLSGIAAGMCALVGAHFAKYEIAGHYSVTTSSLADNTNFAFFLRQLYNDPLFLIAALTFNSALLLAFIFTYLRNKKHHAAIWTPTSRRLLFSVGLPLFVGGIFIVKLVQFGGFALVAPGCLLFYGLALLNGSKYTLCEVKILAYGQIITGLVCCWLPALGLYFWAFGFGILHIVYGSYMWYKYERQETINN